MPPRLSKRQQRELEELEALSSSGTPVSVDESGDDEPLASQHGTFAAFTIEEEEDDEEEKPSRKKPKKKKKKLAVASTVTSSAKIEAIPSTDDPASEITKNEKKALKKARQKERKAGTDELDKALAELSIPNPGHKDVPYNVNGQVNLQDLLSVSLQNLDSEAEMRRFFGAKVVQANRPNDRSGRKNQATPVRSNLSHPQSTWWPAKDRDGLSLRQLTDSEVAAKLSRHSWNLSSEKWWTIEYSHRYKSVTKAFIRAVLAGDPQGLWDLMNKLAWHADTLLQLSEVYRHREEYSQAVDFIERSLFTYERCLTGAFNFTSGLNRLEFDRVENRPFFLAIHRQVADLQRRGCVRTSFEFARLLYALDPWQDPHGAAFHLEYLAVKAGMHDWLLDVYDLFSQKKHDKDTRLNPSLLPGWAYARALALKIAEDAEKDRNHSKSSAALKEAALDFPSIIPLLADKLDLPLAANIRAHSGLKIETSAHGLSQPTAIMHLLSHLYVQRSSSIWKDQAKWFSSIISEAFSLAPSTLPVTARRSALLALYENENLCHSVYRQLIVLETTYKKFWPFIPPRILESKGLECDPLPPATSISRYDDTFFDGIQDSYAPRARTRRQREMDERRLAQFIPDAIFRGQLQAFFENHPDFAQRFPGGILQFAQFAGQLPPDVLEDLLLVEVANNGEFAAPAGGMPGGFGEEEHGIGPDFALAGPNQDMAPPPPVEEEVEEDSAGEEDTDEDISPMPRVLRNIFGRFFGGTVQHDDSSSDDEEPLAPRDNTGVD